MFRKPYINFKTVICELIGIVLGVIASILAILLVKTDNLDVFMLPMVLLITCIGMMLTLHLLPIKWFNIPLVPKEGREILIYSHFSFMIGLLIAETGVFSMVSVVITIVTDRISVIASLIYAIIATVTMIAIFIKACKDNK